MHIHWLVMRLQNHSRIERPTAVPYILGSMVITLTTPSDLLNVLFLSLSLILIWQNKCLQTGFQVGMERVLGVDAPVVTADSQTVSESSRRDVNEADTLEEIERRDAARQRYQRLYWESVPEDGRVRMCKHFLLW